MNKNYASKSVLLINHLTDVNSVHISTMTAVSLSALLLESHTVVTVAKPVFGEARSGHEEFGIK